MEVLTLGELRKAFDTTVKASEVIVPKLDDAVVAAGRRIADQIDYATENLSGQDLTKALYLTPHLMNVLKELLATPAARQAPAKPAASAPAKEQPASGKLASLASVPRPKRAG